MTPRIRQIRTSKYNSPENIKAWLDYLLKYAVDNAVITPEQALAMQAVGDAMIADGQWRGNISEKLLPMSGGHELLRRGLLYL